MRNSIIKSFATGIAVCAATIAGIVFAARAAAVPVDDIDMSEEAIAYATQYNQYICGALLANPTNSGVVRVLEMIYNDGWTNYESGAILGYAVMSECPSEWDVLERFVSTPLPAEVA